MKENKFLTFFNKSKGYITSIVNVAVVVWVPKESQTFVLTCYNGLFVIVDACLNHFLKDKE